MTNATHDTRYKALFGHPDMVRELIMGFVHDDYLQHLDFDTLEKVSESYVSDTFQVREEDAVWRIKAGEGFAYVYLMLEFQSTVDAFMALRVMVYVGLLYQELIKRGEVGSSGQLPPVLPIVLYNGESRWHAAEDVTELIASAPGLLSDFRPSMRYLLIDEGRYSDSELASQRNVVAAIFRLEQQPTAAAVRDVTTQLSMWLVDRPDIRQIVSGWMLSTLGPRFGIDVTEADLGQLADVKGIGVMMIERLEARERSIREEGKREGTREGEQRALIRQLKRKFGDLSHEVQEQVDQAPLSQLEHWLDNVLDARTLNEVFTDGDAMH